MNENQPIEEGQILIGSLFNEPMRVETVRSAGPDTISACGRRRGRENNYGGPCFWRCPDEKILTTEDFTEGRRENCNHIGH